jgi:hypothetical protein
MRIFLDGQELDFTLETERTLGDLLSGMEDWIEGAERSICGVAIDGETVDAFGLDAVFSRSLDGINVIDLATSGKKELLDEALRSFAKLEKEVPALCVSLEDVPLFLQTGKDAQAAAIIKDFSDLAGKILLIAEVFNRNGVAQSVENEAWKEKARALAPVISALCASYENGDMVLAGDTCEYEAAPLLRGLFAAMREWTSVETCLYTP